MTLATDVVSTGRAPVGRWRRAAPPAPPEQDARQLLLPFDQVGATAPKEVSHDR